MLMYEESRGLEKWITYSVARLLVFVHAWNISEEDEYDEEVW